MWLRYYFCNFQTQHHHIPHQDFGPVFTRVLPAEGASFLSSEYESIDNVLQWHWLHLKNTYNEYSYMNNLFVQCRSFLDWGTCVNVWHLMSLPSTCSENAVGGKLMITQYISDTVMILWWKPFFATTSIKIYNCLYRNKWSNIISGVHSEVWTVKRV